MHAVDPEPLRTRIEQAADPDEVAALAGQFPGLLVRMSEQGHPAERISLSLSKLGESATRRLLQMAEAELGPPPVAYAFIVAGSLGRGEQIAGSDQDNALILDDSYEPRQHDAYFARLAASVCDGLATCGYAYCPGNIMASNPRWRLSLSGWLACFGRWIDTPDPKALLNSSIFFDLRSPAGQPGLLERLRQAILARTADNARFQGHLAASALQFRPALTWYGGLRFRRSGDGEPVIDLKRFGVTPLVDLARVHALAAGDPGLGTRERLRAMREEGALTAAQLEELLGAFDFISILRIEHQARQIRAGAEPDYLLPRDSLSPSDRRQLKSAFRCVRAAQRRMARRFRAEDFR